MTAIPLAVCRWRSEPTAPGRHMCLSPKMVVGPSGVPDAGCHACVYRDHPPPARTTAPCVHLLPRVGTIPCPPCSAAAGRAIELPLHGCALHGRCTIGRPAPGLHCCASCPDRRPEYVRPGVGSVRHLTYFVFPRGPIWRWNVAHLKERLSLFNGGRTIAVATDQTSDPPEVVEAEFAGLDVQFIRYRNCPVTKERQAVIPLLESVERYQGEGDVTWYGHAKGIGSSLVGTGVRTWAEEMYRGTLDYWPAVRRALADHVSCGVLRRRARHPPGVPVQWHYSGSFRWIRNRDIYRRDWRHITMDWGAPEMWPPMHIAYEESACLYGEAVGVGGYWYDQAMWDQWGTAAADDWRAAHAHDRWAPLLATVILTSWRQPERVHEAIASVRSQTSDSWQLLLCDQGVLAGAGAFDRYRDDARVSVLIGGSSQLTTPTHNGQAWAINQAWRAGRVRGDVVLCLSDDDLLDPHLVETLLARAAVQPRERAWYGTARRQRVHTGGRVEDLGELRADGVAGPANRLCGRIDGMQVAVRRGAWVDWPEDGGRADHADGLWIDSIGERVPITPLAIACGVHRHTALSTYTR